ncbi:hypothetical protein FRC17_005481 [Serendipita sp. 399]|nr:hypothetical protein FRC17_005481 [Serendipita sp. 399]
MAPTTYQILTPEQIEHFLEHGYVVIRSAFTREQAAEATKDVWTRLGYDPDDTSTWVSERVNMPWHRRFAVQEFAPRAWGAICDLLGGEERVDEGASSWSDGFICNFGTVEFEQALAGARENGGGGEDRIKRELNDPKKLTNWHVDGDFFVHFLDSREQALLVIPLFSDVEEDGGGTMICPDGIGRLGKWLMDHPQGVYPRMRPVDEPEGDFTELSWYNTTIQGCSDFRQMTGKAGDVVLMHPFMLHSASRNLLRTHRIITNPPVGLREPFNYDRENRDDYSLVERKTLKEIGKLLKTEGKIASETDVNNGLKGWRITGERRRIVPERVRVQEEMKLKEEARLRGERTEANQTDGIRS